MPPTVPLVLVWHHHQPLYRDLTRPTARGSYRKPWVRLHGLRDYYAMAALAARHRAVRLTFNFSACLLWQIQDYVQGGASDEALELTLTPAEALDAGQRGRLLDTFFDANPANQILPHRRYRELFERHRVGGLFAAQDLRDLQMWFNLAWFPHEMRARSVGLVTGETVNVTPFIDKERGFTHQDLEAMVAEQRKVLRGIIPLHRLLQDQGRIEVAVTPFYHPILPLLIDTAAATVDRPGATLPRPFRHPEDAEAQVRLAVEAYRIWFGQAPRGTWPAEGAVSQAVIPLLARAGLRWMATDQGVLGRSGRWGYRDAEAEVRTRIYRAAEDGQEIATFFRDRELSDDIGFHCHAGADPAAAARGWLDKLARRRAALPAGDGPRAITVLLDGENAWGSYRQDGRPFLEALYAGLDQEGQTATPAGLLGELAASPQVHALFTASWIDEAGSAHGVDLGTWIGEEQENTAWDLLGAARDALTASGATPASAPRAFQALYAAEGSDWFWWYGVDQGRDGHPGFDELFRLHLKTVYLALGLPPPPALDQPIIDRRR